MRTIAVLLLLLSPACQQALSQVFPADGSKLHYRIIGFTFPVAGTNTSFTLEVAKGYYNSPDSFAKNIIVLQKGMAGRVIAEVPSFATSYTWRVVVSKKAPSALYHFSTVNAYYGDTNRARLRIIKKAEQFKDAYVFSDGNRALYDMNGNPVWLLPDVDGVIGPRDLICDLKMTNHGTITFIARDKQAFEISYNGDVLWRGPQNKLMAHYQHFHHEFYRRPNGNYMILSTEPGCWKSKAPSAADSSIYEFSAEPHPGDTAFHIFPFGSLMEYDKAGNIVWEWKALDYVRHADLMKHDLSKSKGFDVHANSFWFDEKGKVIYISLRNANRIVKIRYPDGKLLAAYGDPGTDPAHGLFCGQHSVGRTADGCISLYDNNVCAKDSALPKVLLLREPADGKENVSIAWQYDCTVDGLPAVKHPAGEYTTGGNVTELPDGELMVSMSYPYGKIFIINRNKETTWSAVAEQRGAYSTNWEMVPQYRASIITNRQQLEHLVWGEEAK